MENKRKIHSGIAFWEYEITLARTMLDTLRTTLEFLYYLMDHRSEAPFSMILIALDRIGSMQELQRIKRGTDLLFELDREHGIYVFVCQATDEEGGRQYAEILLSTIRTRWDLHENYCVLSTVDSTRYSIQDVIFRMVETYIHAHKIARSDEVILCRPGEERSSDPVPAT